MVLTKSGRGIHRQDLLDTLSGLDFLADQACLVFDAAKPGYQQQDHTVGTGSSDHCLPAPRRLGCEPLDPTDQIGADFDQFKGLGKSRRAVSGTVIGRYA